MSERKMPSIEDYPSNANGEKPVPEKREVVKTVIHGKVKKKSSIFRSVKDEFISEDAPSMGEYLVHDILFPALRDLINDICHGAIDAAFGGGGNYRSRSSRGGGSYITYNRYYDDRHRRKRDRDDDRYEVRKRNRDLDDYVFELRGDAEDVLDRMCDYLERYDSVPVSYFYDLCGETVPGDWVSDDWGWTNLSGVKVRGVRGGYIIDFPKIRPI